MNYFANKRREEDNMTDETKREKFVRLAEKRTNRIIDQLELLGNLSNTSAYEYTSTDVNKMFKAIEETLNETKRKFSKQGKKSISKFTLD